MKKNWNITGTNSCRFSRKLQKPQKLVLTKYWYCQNLISANINLLEIGSIVLPCMWNSFTFTACRASCYEFHWKMYVQIGKNKNGNIKEFSRSVYLYTMYIYFSIEEALKAHFISCTAPFQEHLFSRHGLAQLIKWALIACSMLIYI